MATQGQNNLQTQGTLNPSNTTLNNRGNQIKPKNPGGVVETMAYKLFKSDCLGTGHRNICHEEKPSCFYSHVDHTSCSNEDVLIGGMCIKHNQEMEQRSYVGVQRFGETILECVPVRQSEYTPRGFLFSTLNPMSSNEVKAVISVLTTQGISSINNVAQFISTLSSDVNECHAADKASVEIFCIKLASIYQKYLNKLPQNVLDADICLEISADQELALKKNKWWVDLNASNLIAKPSERLYVIKLKNFLIIDQVILLGYHMQVENSIGSLPNVIPSYQRIIHGSGYGIYNALDVITKQVNKQYCEYEPMIQSALIKSKLPINTNLDKLILAATVGYGHPPALLVVERSFKYDSVDNKFQTDFRTPY